MPRIYIWNQSAKKFQRRKQGQEVSGDPQIFFMDYNVFTQSIPAMMNIFFTLLLVNIPGPTLFQHLQTVNGALCSTYREM